MPALSPAVRRPRILFCVDVPMWAHDFKTTNIIRHLSDHYDFRKRFHADLTPDDARWADVIVVYYWQQLLAVSWLPEFFPGRVTLGGISDHTDLEGDARAPGLRRLDLFDAVWVHNVFLWEEFEPRFFKPFHLARNGVDTTFYRPATPEPSRRRPGAPLVVGWAGSLTNHGTKRGYGDVIVPAIAMTPGVELRTAAREDRWRGPEEMRDFYRELDVYLVASRVEGTPNPGLESAACGVPAVSTRVGNMVELVEDGENGLLVDRSPEAFSAALARLRDDDALLHRFKTRIRRDIAAWDWSVRARDYDRMFRDGLRRKGWSL